MKMYDDLNKVRTSRNYWLHNFEQVDENLASLAIQTSQRLFEQAAKIKLSLTISRSISYYEANLTGRLNIRLISLHTAVFISLVVGLRTYDIIPH